MEQKTENRNRVASQEEPHQNVVLFRLSMRDLSNVTLILPLTGLLVCFVTG